MLRRNLTKWMLAAAVAVAALAFDVQNSMAFGHRHGSWGSSGGSWGSSGGSWGSSGGSWGSSGGWGHHRGYYSSGGSWGSSGGSSGGWGSSGGSSGGYTYWGSSGGSSGGSVIYDGAPSIPARPSDAAPTPPGGETPPTPMPGAMYRSFDGAQTALLNVSVPAEAKVFVNGAATTSTGSQRQFVSRGLKSGNRYAYEIKAEFVRDGNTVTESKTITLAPGQYAGLAFNFDANKEAPIANGNKAKTKLTLHVPADAKVFLAGRETASTGDVREFTTSKLNAGAEWKNYTVRVVSNIDGREVSKEETITLTGGVDRDLTIDLNSNAVASTAAVTR